MFTAGFFLLWFGVGAVVAGILAALGVGAIGQWAAFGGLSLVLFFVSRPFANRVSKEQPPGIGADRLIGKEGIVIEEISGGPNTGRVRVGSEDWRATTEGDGVIANGSRVVVAAISGNHLVVNLKEGI
jgi:membrane protein implicated in regulation of membrane protease activity